MKKKYYSVSDLCKITGISRRTVHYYDEINLLNASSKSSKGYRLYDVDDIERLQIILFLKEMNLPLKEIANIIKLPKKEQDEILKNHYEILSRKKEKLEKTISNLKSYLAGASILELDIFDNTNIQPINKQHMMEGKLVYGDTEIYRDYEEKMSSLSIKERERLFIDFNDKMNGVFMAFSKKIHGSPTSDEVQHIVKEWIDIFNSIFAYDKDLLRCIAESYKFDNRFKKYINQFSDGDLSDFIYKAIIFYCDSN